VHGHAGSARNVFGAPLTQGNLAPLLRAARSSALFSSLSDPDADMVLSFCHCRVVEKDVRLCEAGDQADCWLFIVDGRVNLTGDTADRQVLRVGAAGNSPLQTTPRRRPMQAMRCRREGFLQSLFSSPDLATRHTGQASPLKFQPDHLSKITTEDSLNKGACPLVYPPIQREAFRGMLIFCT